MAAYGGLLYQLSYKPPRAPAPLRARRDDPCTTHMLQECILAAPRVVQDLSPCAKLSSNDAMRQASTFHSLHAISKQLAPVASHGIDIVEAPSFSLHCFESPTGVKFFVTAKPRTPDVTSFLRKVYEFYSDCVLKNPFYELDMPIRVKLFDASVERYAREAGLGSAAATAAAAR